MRTKNDIVIQTGEGMLALWGALKSTLKPGDKVLALSTGIFGRGIGVMAEGLDCEVHLIEFGFDESINDFDIIEKAIQEFKPKMITMVHCETPSGTINPVEKIGALKEKHNVPLLYVDAVSSMGGTVVEADKWNIDLCLGASQKCISAPANMAFLAVSDKAWEIIEETDYNGYDALAPFRFATQTRYFPYTPYWHGTAQLHKACELLVKEGLNKVFARHEKVASYCRKRLLEMGLQLYAVPDATFSPTVTSVYVPKGWTWNKLDAKLRERGLFLGGNYGCLAGKVFRIGHMGYQANMDEVEKALDILNEVLKK
jgi:aspartate aminotransferase-like enzyme